MSRSVATIAWESTGTALMNSLRWLYGHLASGKSATVPATPRNVEDQIASLIRRSAAQAGVVGFGTGLGGIFTLPITLPANVAGVAALQIHMVQEMARMRGYDLRSEQVESLTLVCLTGNAAVDILKDVGIAVGRKLTQQAVGQISGAALLRINQAVGFRLVTKGGTTGLVNLSKAVPFVGGLVGGTIDGISTAAVGNAAKVLFPHVNGTEQARDEQDDVIYGAAPPEQKLLSPPDLARN
jgi:uncharacterized protein (DUF697 family)